MKAGTIEIKDANVLEGLMAKKFDPALIPVIVWVAVTFGLVITESYRDKRHANDVHGTDPVRAVDLRTRCYDGDGAYRIMDEINNRWIYDPGRPDKKVAMIHDVGQGLHFHIQVHPNTVRR